jgi:hypothetical protein
MQSLGFGNDKLKKPVEIKPLLSDRHRGQGCDDRGGGSAG